MNGSSGSPPHFQQLLAKLCPYVAIGTCSRWQCVELHLVQSRMAAVTIRVPKALNILPTVKSKLVRSSTDSNCRWLSFHFYITVFVIFINFSEKLPPREVSRNFGFTSSTISRAVSSLSFRGVASANIPKTSLHIFGCVIFFTAPLPSNDHWSSFGIKHNQFGCSNVPQHGG